MNKLLMKAALPCALMVSGMAPHLFGDSYDKKTDVTISNPVEVPGAILQPGKYMFKLVNNASNRHIVEISSEDGKKVYAIVFTVAARRLEPSSKTILTFYEMPTGTPEAVRYWYWPGELDGQEFTYPKDRAALISKATGVKVKEQPEDFDNHGNGGAVVSSNETDKDNDKHETEIAAAPQTPVVAPEPAPIVEDKSNTVIAQNEPAPRSTDIPAPPAPVVEQHEPAPAPAPVTTASVDTSSNQLPRTASDLPLIGLVGALSLAAAAATRSALRNRA